MEGQGGAFLAKKIGAIGAKYAGAGHLIEEMTLVDNNWRKEQEEKGILILTKFISRR